MIFISFVNFNNSCKSQRQMKHKKLRAFNIPHPKASNQKRIFLVTIFQYDFHDNPIKPSWHGILFARNKRFLILSTVDILETYYEGILVFIFPFSFFFKKLSKVYLGKIEIKSLKFLQYF